MAPAWRRVPTMAALCPVRREPLYRGDFFIMIIFDQNEREKNIACKIGGATRGGKRWSVLGWGVVGHAAAATKHVPNHIGRYRISSGRGGKTSEERKGTAPADELGLFARVTPQQVA
jgi:hypothetical protein